MPAKNTLQPKVIILGLSFLGVAVVAFIAGMVTQRNLASMFKSNAPALLLPAEGAVLDSDKPDDWEFSWATVPDAKLYTVYIWHQDVGESVREVKIPSYRIPNMQLVNDTPQARKGWIWKVRAQVGGEWTEWSEPRNFEIKAKRK
jgi:hypothetical protein